MGGAVLLLGLWFSFGATHVILAGYRLRQWLVFRLGGERRFLWFFSAIAWIQFTALAVVAARLHTSGPPGFAPEASPWSGAFLASATVAGFALMIGALAPSSYWSSPFAVLGEEERSAGGLQRVTRHPFFAGLVLWTGARAVLAPHVTSAIFFGGFAVLSVVGSTHQARKLLRRYGEAFAHYLAVTSAIPFLAILQGRQQLVLRELPWPALALGAALGVGVHHAGDGIFAYAGAPIIVTVVLGSVVIGAIAMRSRRPSGRKLDDLSEPLRTRP